MEPRQESPGAIMMIQVIHSISSPPQPKLDLSSHAVVTGFTVEPSWMDMNEVSLIRINN